MLAGVFEVVDLLDEVDDDAVDVEVVVVVVVVVELVVSVGAVGVGCAESVIRTGSGSARFLSLFEGEQMIWQC